MLQRTENRLPLCRLSTPLLPSTSARTLDRCSWDRYSLSPSMGCIHSNHKIHFPQKVWEYMGEWAITTVCPSLSPPIPNSPIEPLLGWCSCGTTKSLSDVAPQWYKLNLCLCTWRFNAQLPSYKDCKVLIEGLTGTTIYGTWEKALYCHPGVNILLRMTIASARWYGEPLG